MKKYITLCVLACLAQGHAAIGKTALMAKVAEEARQKALMQQLAEDFKKIEDAELDRKNAEELRAAAELDREKNENRREFLTTQRAEKLEKTRVKIKKFVEDFANATNTKWNQWTVDTLQDLDKWKKSIKP